MTNRIYPLMSVQGVERPFPSFDKINLNTIESTNILHFFENIAFPLPHKIKMQYLHFRSQTEYFLLSGKIPEVISR